MLNEIRLLAEALDRCRQSVPPSYPYLKSMPRTLTYLLRVGEDGAVVSCEVRSWEEAGENGLKLKRIESGSAGVSFPGFNFEEGSLARLDKCWRKFPRRLREVFSDCSDEGSQSFRELVERCANSVATKEDLRDSIVRALRDATSGQFPRQTKIKLSVFLDVDNPSRFKYPVAHPKTMKFLNQHLLEKLGTESFATGGKGAKKRRGRDAYGDSGEIQTRFPEAVLNVLGKTVLFSMTGDSPCQSRYGKVESELFPVVKSSAARMNEVLDWVTSGDRRGRTWCAVPGEKLTVRNGRRVRQNDLLISYCEMQPQNAGTFARFFGGNAKENVTSEVFEQACQSVNRALSGIPQEIDPSVHVLVLARVDPGRVKVVLSEIYAAQAIEIAGKRWADASKNIPPVTILLPGNRGESAEQRSPRTLFPDEAVRCLNRNWVHGAGEYVELRGCALTDVHRILMWNDSAVAERLLNLAVRRFTSLMSAVGHARHRDKETDISPRARRDVLTALSMMGVLLSVVGRQKEAYMLASPFLIGRLFSLADQLHRLYSEVVRKSVPRQLLGNALLATALDRPIVALALLAQRLLPYKAWADTVTEGEKIGLARWFSKELGRNSADIHAQGIPERTDDASKAEMLLGYLSGNRSAEEEGAK